MKCATPYDCVAFACHAFQVPFEDFYGLGRHDMEIMARNSAVGLSRRFTHASYPDIARAMNCMAHSSVMRQYQQWMRRSRRWRGTIEQQFMVWSKQRGILFAGDEFPQVSGAQAYMFIEHLKAAQAA